MKTQLKRLATLGAGVALVGLAGVLSTANADHHGDHDGKEKKAERAEIGKPAPMFKLKDVNGKEFDLNDYKGQIIVLEWFNPECPFVPPVHTSSEYRELRNSIWEADDSAWFAINSGAPGLQGHGIEKNRSFYEQWEMTHPLLIDEPGKVGRMYDARTSPHVYIIDKEGILRYHGAINNYPMNRVRGDEKISYVQRALEQLRNGEEVSPSHVRPWGCSVKYADS